MTHFHFEKHLWLYYFEVIFFQGGPTTVIDQSCSLSRTWRDPVSFTMPHTEWQITLMFLDVSEKDVLISTWIRRNLGYVFVVNYILFSYKRGWMVKWNMPQLFPILKRQNGRFHWEFIVWLRQNKIKQCQHDQVALNIYRKICLYYNCVVHEWPTTGIFFL